MRYPSLPFILSLLLGSSAFGALPVTAQQAPAHTKPTIQQPVKDQQNPIVGTATPSTDKAPMQVQLWIKNSANSEAVPQGATENVGKDGTYAIHQTAILGQILEVREVGSSAPIDDSAKSADVTVLAPDNEREHTDFTAGTVISESESNFAQADTFLAFNVDRALYLPGLYSERRMTCAEKVAAKNTPCHLSRRPGLNTFFQARLTTIPINASTTTQTTMQTVASTGTTTTTPSFSSVLTSQKTGHFEGGFYAPFAFGRVPTHTTEPQTQTFYLAPIFRFGFNTLASGAQTTSTTSSTSTGTTTTSTTPTALGTTNPLSNAYNFFTMGARIGTATIEPGSLHNIHDFDMTIGKFSNLDNLYCPTGTRYTACAAIPATSTAAAIPATAEDRYRPFRLSFEGYYQVPITGFILGLSANVPAGLFDRGTRTDINNRAPADLRFLFGYKFDVNKLFKALPMITQ